MTHTHRLTLTLVVTLAGQSLPAWGSLPPEVEDPQCQGVHKEPAARHSHALRKRGRRPGPPAGLLLIAGA